MPRPCCRRRIEGAPPAGVFKPAGIPGRFLEEVVLGLDGLEALRLADLEGLYQEAAAERMGVSRPTFARIVEAARRKVASALVRGQALKIGGGTVDLVGQRAFLCEACGREWTLPFGTGRPPGCPACAAKGFRRTDGGPARARR